MGSKAKGEGYADGSAAAGGYTAIEPGRDGQARCHDPYLRCALYGAAQVVLGVRGSCVLSHSPQGCYQLVEVAFEWQDADYADRGDLRGGYSLSMTFVASLIAEPASRARW